MFTHLEKKFTSVHTLAALGNLVVTWPGAERALRAAENALFGVFTNRAVKSR